MSKNTVTIDPIQNIVTKKYQSRISFDMEAYILSAFGESNLTPKILHQTTDLLVVSYILGKNFLEILEMAAKGHLAFSEATRLFEQLLNWLFEFQACFFVFTGRHVALQDIHLKNFIYAKKEQAVFGIDFESWRYGKPEENFAALLVFIRSYNLPNPSIAEGIYQHLLDRLICDSRLNADILRTCLAQKHKLLSQRRSTRSLFNQSGAIVIEGDKGKGKLGRYTVLEHLAYQLDMFDTIITAKNGLQDLSEIHTPLVFFAHSDIPTLTGEFIMDLYSQLKDEDECLIPVLDGQPCFLFGLLRRRILPKIGGHPLAEALALGLGDIAARYVALNALGEPALAPTTYIGN